MTGKKTDLNIYMNISTNDDKLDCTNRVMNVHSKNVSRSEV